MKYSLLLAVSSLAFGQSTTSSYITDLNGNSVPASTVVSNDDTHTDLWRSINGREIPLEQTETHVLKKDASGVTTETIVRRYDRNGQLTSTEKTVTEQQIRPNGSTAHSTTYMSDLNGTMRETERKTVETTTQGSTTNTQTEVERPSIDGGMQTVEKRSAVSEKSGENSHEDETVYRRNGDGGFAVAQRTVSDVTHSGHKTTESSAVYQPIANFGQLQLSRQQVTTTTAQPDGSESKQVDYYLPSLPGVAPTSESGQKLWEQDTVERKKQSNGAVVETVTARRADPNHPNQLGPAEQLSETVCRGNCAGK